MPIAEWEQEYADLKTQRDSDYTKLKDTRTEVAELQKIRKCVDIVLRANQADLVSFLQSQGEQLTRAGNEYRWKRHDSLTVRETNGTGTARVRAATPPPRPSKPKG